MSALLPMATAFSCTRCSVSRNFGKLSARPSVTRSQMFFAVRELLAHFAQDRLQPDHVRVERLRRRDESREPVGLLHRLDGGRRRRAHGDVVEHLAPQARRRP